MFVVATNDTMSWHPNQGNIRLSNSLQRKQSDKFFCMQKKVFRETWRFKTSALEYEKFYVRMDTTVKFITIRW